MPLPSFMFLLAAIAASTSDTPRTNNNFTVAAYLPEWRYEGANWADMSRTVTQLILFSLEVQPSGRLSAYDRLPRRELMLEARAATRAAGSQLLVCVGGNGRSGGFSRAVSTSNSRARFVESLVKVCDQHELDGVDLNWEYPGYEFGRGYLDEAAIERDYRGLRLLLKALHAAFAPTGRIITLAYYPDGRQEEIFTKHRVGRYVERMHMMSYDQPGKHSSWEFAQRVARQGASLLPAHLVTLGLPFYGRHTATGDWKSYEDLVQRHHASLAVDSDETPDGYFFNSPALITRKTRLAAELGLGGVMIWEVGQDCRVKQVTHGETTHGVTCPDGESSALLTAVRAGLPAPQGQPTPDGSKGEL